MDASAQTNIPLMEKLNFQIRLDVHSAQKMLFNIHNFNAPSTTVDLLEVRTFGKITGGPTTAPREHSASESDAAAILVKGAIEDEAFL